MNINRGLKLLPSKVVVYGPEGIGKTTFISQFPDPLFCDVEGGSGHLDVNRTDVPTSWEMLLGIVREVIANPSVCRTFCIDTADWAERMCIKQVCDKHNQQGIETFGYGKGYVYVYEAFGSLLDLLSELPSRGVIPVLTAHAQLQKVEQPDEMGSYDHYTLKLSKKTGKNVADMVKEWADLLLFANYKTFVVNVDGLGAAKGKNKAQGGKRVMYTSHTPSWDAKNRCGLPDELPFEYAAIGTVIERACAVQNSPVRVPDVRTQQTAPETVKAPSAPLQSQDSAIPASAPTATAELSPDITKEQPSDGTSTALEQASAPSAGCLTPSASICTPLRDLMIANQVTEQELMYAVTQRGYYPEGTPIANYAPDFVDGVLIGAWQQVLGLIQANRVNTPF